MRHLFVPCIAVAAIAFSVMPAAADDQDECNAGIVMIEAELDKSPPQATQTALRRALRDAERESKGAEFDECLDAIEDAKKALSR